MDILRPGRLRQARDSAPVPVRPDPRGTGTRRAVARARPFL